MQGTHRPQTAIVQEQSIWTCIPRPLLNLDSAPSLGPPLRLSEQSQLGTQGRPMYA